MATNKNFEVKNGLSVGGTERISSAGAFTGSLASGVTATTQSATDNSTKIATTAYTDAAITAVIGGSPGTLDTLNELAAAINDDASYASTLTTALATKAPLASPALTGTVTAASHVQIAGNLDVVGQIAAYNNTGSSWGTMGLRATDYTFKNSGGTIKVAIDSDGNVGIGTSTPQKKVHIEHTAGASEGILISGASDTNGHTAGILLRAEGGEADSALRAKAGIFLERTATYGVGKLHIANRHNGDNTSATISDANITIYDDKVGIGTTSPGAALEVARGNAGYIAMFGAPQGSGKVVLFKDNHASPNKYNWLVGAQYNTNNAFEITPSTVVGGYTFNQPSITVLHSGKVGIGTNAPGNMLDVKASGNDQGIMLKSTNNSNLIWLHQQSTSEGVLRIYGSGGAKVIIPGHNSPTYFNNGNNVGIGITDPDHKLEIYSGDYTTLKLRAPSYPTLKFEAINQNSGNGASIAVGANNALVLSPNNSTVGIVVANNGDVGIGGAPGNAGKLTVYDAATSNCGIRTRTGTSTHYTNVATTHTAVTANRYWHIKTNFYSTNNIMFVARVHGYSYGNSGHIVDIQRSGYAYGAHGQITGSQSVNNGSSSDTLTTYFASDNRMCLKLTTPAGGYYNGYSLDFKTLNPTGYHWDFEVLDHVINATSGNHF